MPLGGNCCSALFGLVRSGSVTWVVVCDLLDGGHQRVTVPFYCHKCDLLSQVVIPAASRACFPTGPEHEIRGVQSMKLCTLCCLRKFRR